MSTKRAVDYDQTAERPSRPKPTNREGVPYECVEARGATRVDSKPQFERKHELASDPGAKAQGAISGTESGFANAKRREASVLKNRKATAAVFEANRKKSSTV